MLDYSKSFIEVQFPVSKISKESYKERKANLGQTLTGVGKWWGRKPLILVRASIIGMLMPVSDNPQKDMEIFLKILTMDNEGLLLRKTKSLKQQDIYENLSEQEKHRYFVLKNGKPIFVPGISKEEKEELQNKVFLKMGYDEKIANAVRPEEVELLDEEAWRIINEHLEIDAKNIQELVNQLGLKRFGHTPRIGDCFSGGGSIPFESARIGADTFASDLNPVAGLLTWSDLNLLFETEEKLNEIFEYRQKIYDNVEKIILEMGIENNEKGDRAISYLYCNEIICPECGYKVPLIPSGIIGKGTKTIVELIANKNNGFDFKIMSNVNSSLYKKAEELKTIGKDGVKCPNCLNITPIPALRKDRKDKNGNVIYGLREWGKNEFKPKDTDVFQERLYAIKYETKEGKRYYSAPTEKDNINEEIIDTFMKKNFIEWQNKSYIPSDEIEDGYNTSQIVRERGWKYWHQLFNSRQLLTHGLLAKEILEGTNRKEKNAIVLLGLNKCIDWNSKLSRWNGGIGNEKTEQTFYNQAYNTLFNYGARSLKMLENSWFGEIRNFKTNSNRKEIKLSDAREIDYECDLWITDPPYADAVNYHELSEFFLAWDAPILKKAFPEWYSDSKRALAVKGKGKDFNESMIEVYRNLAKHMPDNGLQMVMFTHQDVSVWAELSMILWSAGLSVVSAWNIATETESGGLKDGNYVKGTVLLVLRKQISSETAFLDELMGKVDEEVKLQMESMRNLENKEEPNFSDADYLLAAYAASLKVLTSYKNIEDIDVDYELSKVGKTREKSQIEQIIEEAVKIAYDLLTPVGFDTFTWKTLLPEERFYIKSLDVEKEGANQVSIYQELARGFGVKEYTNLMNNIKANMARVRTASEYGEKDFNGESDYSKSLIRNVLVAIYKSVKDENTESGKKSLRSNYPSYWSKRNDIVRVLEFISLLGQIEGMEHWKIDSEYASYLKEVIKNDTI